MDSTPKVPAIIALLTKKFDINGWDPLGTKRPYCTTYNNLQLDMIIIAHTLSHHSTTGFIITNISVRTWTVPGLLSNRDCKFSTNAPLAAMAIELPALSCRRCNDHTQPCATQCIDHKPFCGLRPGTFGEAV